MDLAIIGCGQVVETFHLPALSKVQGMKATILVDRNLERAQGLSGRFGIPQVEAHFESVIGKCDAALVATPNQYHADICTFLLEKGCHVLVEKPMAVRVAECDRMIRAATESGVVLSAAMVRRFTLTHKIMHDLIYGEAFGSVLRAVIREGVVYNWPAVTGFFLNPQEANGGVLIDFGPHVLDALIWWFGDLKVESFKDDSFGGVEAECSIGLIGVEKIPIAVELSRLRKLPCTARIECARATLEVNLRSSDIALKIQGVPYTFRGRVEAAERDNGSLEMDPFQLQLEAFRRDIQSNAGVTATALAARKIAALFEKGYSIKTNLDGPASPVFAKTFAARD